MPLDDKNSCAATNGPAFRQVVKTDSTAVWGGATGITCGDIQLGTSDVEGPSFTQSSTGGINGVGTADFTPPVAPETVDGLVHYQPTVVPFAFYANDALPTTAPMSNLTRTQAVNLFSGTVENWNQLQGFSPNKGVVLCMRHAGSGTHATLDKAVMRGDASLPTSEVQADEPGTTADVYFYQSSSSAATCIAGNGTGGAGGAAYIAVGYLDADATKTGAHQLTYQGATATADNIKKGTYDFWSLQNVYLQPTDDTLLVQKMMDFAKDNVPSGKAAYWTTYNSLEVIKATDSSLPVMK
jgi:ABC-type phosphate transport system substrate-binding protein